MAKVSNSYGTIVSKGVKAKVAELSLNLNTGVYLYGEGSPYGTMPNEIIKSVDDSGTASNCVEKLALFTEADGFVDPKAGTFKINKEQTADELLNEVANYTAYFGGAFALRVLYRNDGTIGAVYNCKVEQLRKKRDGSFIYNEFMGTKLYKKNMDINIPAFNPNIPQPERIKIITDQIAEYGHQIGEIYYIFQKAAGFLKDVYPVPYWYSGMEDIESDASLQRQDRRNVVKGWKAKVIVEQGVDLDKEKKDEFGKTDQDYFDESLKRFLGEDGDDVLILPGSMNDKSGVTIVNSSDLLDGLNTTRDRIGRAICRHMGVPPVLVGFDVAAILGNQQALVNSLKLFNKIILKTQNRISRVFKELFPTIDWTISTLNIYDFIPDQVWAKLTDEEIRSIAGYEPIESVVPNEIDSMVNRLNSMSPLVANKILESLTEDELRAMLGKGPKTTTP